MKKLTTRVVILLSIAEFVLVLLSWLLSALTTYNISSLLSSEGIRWFLGQYIDIIDSPVLANLLLLGIAIGMLKHSGIVSNAKVYRSHFGWRLVFAAMTIYVFLILMLTVMPHAVLLSPTGKLFPSPFSRALVPILIFGLSLASSIYGFSTNTFASLTDLIQSAVCGISLIAPWLLLYVFFIQFYESLCFVFVLNTNF